MEKRYEVLIASEKERDLFYSLRDESKDAKYGVIGHLRCDFGSGEYFHFTFWDRDDNADIKTQEFKDELDAVVNELREPGGVLSNLSDMTAYCDKNESARYGNWCYDNNYGFKIETEMISYYIRCCPRKGEYNAYVYCYSRERLSAFLKSAE